METGRGSTRSHSVENSLWRRLWNIVRLRDDEKVNVALHIKETVIKISKWAHMVVATAEEIK